jgi:hypothetical protein
MKRALKTINPPTAAYTPFTLDVETPGTLRAILTGYEPPPTVITSTAGTTPADMLPIPVLLFEVDPDAAVVKRNFVWLPAGKAIHYAGTLTFAGTYVDERTGMPLVLYEATAA